MGDQTPGTDPNATNKTDPNATNNTGAGSGGGTNETFEGWLDKQDARVKGLYAEHTAGLKSALEKERTEKKGLADQLKDLLPKAEKGSEFEKKLSETLTQLEESDRRSTFLEEAIKPENGCTNPGGAYKIAKADNLFTRTGLPDWPSIKKAAPEFFKTKGSTDGGAGSQTDTKKPAGSAMNSFIRGGRK